MGTSHHKLWLWVFLSLTCTFILFPIGMLETSQRRGLKLLFGFPDFPTFHNAYLSSLLFRNPCLYIEKMRCQILPISGTHTVRGIWGPQIKVMRLVLSLSELGSPATTDDR
jgi:hypothetical protein